MQRVRIKHWSEIYTISNWLEGSPQDKELIAAIFEELSNYWDALPLQLYMVLEDSNGKREEKIVTIRCKDNADRILDIMEEANPEADEDFDYRPVFEKHGVTDIWFQYIQERQLKMLNAWVFKEDDTEVSYTYRHREWKHLLRLSVYFEHLFFYCMCNILYYDDRNEQEADYFPFGDFLPRVDLHRLQDILDMGSLVCTGSYPNVDEFCDELAVKFSRQLKWPYDYHLEERKKKLKMKKL